MEYDNTNTGAIFVNNKKTTDKHPDRTGKLNVGGVEYYLSGWLKTSKSGEQFLSLSVKPVDEQAASKSVSKPAAKSAPAFDDELPPF